MTSAAHSPATPKQPTDQPYYPDTQLFINGLWRDAADGATLPVINPATEQQIGTVAKASEPDLAAAVSAAQDGFKVWKDMPAAKRSRILQQAAQRLRERADDIAQIMTLEQGKPLTQSLGETKMAADTIDWFAGEALRAYGRIVPARASNVQSLVLKTPVGVVAAFTPWNFPINQIVRKLSAALAAGCAIIIKGPEETPASPAALIQAFVDAGVPAGVIGLVYGEPAAISSYLIPAPTVRKISFTGSTAVGKQLAALAGQHMKKATMELGGHAPVLVFADADIDQMIRDMMAAKFRNAGQVCIAPTRFLIERPIYAEVTQRLRDAIDQLQVGNGLQENIDLGPMIHDKGRQRIAEMIRDAEQRGAQCYRGSQSLPETGYFVAPTLLTDVPQDAQILNDEPFGPVLICNAFDDYDMAIREANRLPFGLAAYAYSRNNRTVMALSRDIEAGMLSINHVGLSVPELPFGGVKESGYGSEGGSEAMEAYLDTRLVTISGE